MINPRLYNFLYCITKDGQVKGKLPLSVQAHHALVDGILKGLYCNMRQE